MNENEVIIVDQIHKESFHTIVDRSVRYAIISLPFTIDRMNIPNEKIRALNIAKGKIAEYLFQYFCQLNEIKVDFESTSTPFWTTDNRDFLIGESEWDIKNNFIYHNGTYLSEYNYSDLPALVPNRRTGDQWSKKNDNLFEKTKRTEFLFTFLKMAGLKNGKRGKSFLDINLNHHQENFLRKLYQKYKGEPQVEQPFTKGWFWDQMKKLGDTYFFKIHFIPYLIVTGYANHYHWHVFENTGPFCDHNPFQDYFDQKWYTKSKKGSCNFLKNTLWTKVTNATTPVSNLPSFVSRFPHLKNNLFGARFSYS